VSPSGGCAARELRRQHLNRIHVRAVHPALGVIQIEQHRGCRGHRAKQIAKLAECMGVNRAIESTSANGLGILSALTEK